jgi:hypothetical protein
MKSAFLSLLTCFCLATAFATTPSAPPTKKAATSRSALPDAQQMEKDLQQLNWSQFRSVIESVPKMKADVEVYGPAGWKYVEARYATYPWKKNIDKLDDAQKRQLADLIRRAKTSRQVPTPNR